MLCELLLAHSEPSPWLAVFGRAHIVLLHAPLGILPAITLLEFGAALLRREAPRGAVLALACFAAIACALAAASGLVLAEEDTGPNETRGQHKVLGLVLAGLCVVLAALAMLRGRRPFRITLLAALGVMVPTGHLGGSMTHGRDFLFAPLHEAQKSESSKGAAPATFGATPPTPGTGDTTPHSEFQRTIAPILERCCTKCHNPDKRKGELLLTTAEGIQAGGEDGAVVVAGKPDESPMLQRCLLPLDHDDHMPPEGKPQPTAAELDALKTWIAAGAKFE